MAVRSSQTPGCDLRESTDSIIFTNRMFESANGSDGVAAELQAARLRLESAVGEKAALATELASTQTRLHDALEVLEGVLGERATLRKQARELQAQLALALAEDSSNCGAASAQPPAAAASPGAALPQLQHLHCELSLAQAQLRELQAAQQGWEEERSQLLMEVEEERQRLQEGLAEALTQASSAQHDANAAAERASHWASLAEVLQRSALLSDGPSPLSPASSISRYSRYSPSNCSTATKSMPASESASAHRSSSGKKVSMSRLLAEFRSPTDAASQPRQRLLASPGGGSAAAAEGAGLIAAFQAVAGSPAHALSNDQLQGSPVLQHCASPHPQLYKPAKESAAASTNQAQGSPMLQHCASPHPQAYKAAKEYAAATPGGPAASFGSTASGGGAGGMTASAELAPGTHLHLPRRLPTPGLSCASSVSFDVGGCTAFHNAGEPSPLTPEPASAAATLAASGEGPLSLASPEQDGSSSTPDAAPSSVDTPADAADADATKVHAGRGRSKVAKPHKQGLLGRLLLRTVCAASLQDRPPLEPETRRTAQRWQQA